MEPNSATDDVLLLRKQIASTRTFLLIVAVATLISAIILLPGLPGGATLTNIILDSVMAVAYFLLAWWTRKRPYTAVLVGLLLFLLTVLADIFWNPFGPFNRWQSKIITLLLLFLAISDSKDAERKMKGQA
jgi:peptidoglycan/LPS O-acetylase OafA/YrhL